MIGTGRKAPFGKKTIRRSMISGLDLGSSVSVQVSQLNANVIGEGLSGGSGAPISVNVDGTTIIISDDALSVKNGGIGAVHIADGAVTDVKVANGISYSKLSGAPASLPPNGPAGGDLSGIYPGPSVVRIQGRPVSTNAPATSDTLIWNGSTWLPAPAVIAGSGCTYVGRTLTIANCGGDLAGLHTNALVTGIRGFPLPLSPAPTNLQAITYDSSTQQLAWRTITASGGAGGVLAGSYPNPTLAVPLNHVANIAQDMVSITNSNANGRALALSSATGSDTLRSTNTSGGNAGMLINSSTGRALLFQITNGGNGANGGYGETNGSGNVLVLNYTGGGTSTQTNRNIEIWQANGLNVARMNNVGKLFLAGGSQVGGADVAEAFDVEGPASNYEPGDILTISTLHKRTLMKSYGPGQIVAGIVPTSPGHILTPVGVDDQLRRQHGDGTYDQLVLAGVLGEIPTKVVTESGSILRGDILVTSSTPGAAMKGSASAPARMIVGLALDNYSGAGVGIIPVLR